jgi:hypothetical protein
MRAQRRLAYFKVSFNAFDKSRRLVPWLPSFSYTKMTLRGDARLQGVGRIADVRVVDQFEHAK